MKRPQVQGEEAVGHEHCRPPLLPEEVARGQGIVEGEGNATGRNFPSASRKMKRAAALVQEVREPTPLRIREKLLVIPRNRNRLVRKFKRDR